MSADDIIKRLNLAPHPEGGHYRQTWSADAAEGERAAGTSILYLLAKGERSHWHHVDADEIWHFYAGAPLKLVTSEKDSGPARKTVLGPNILAGETPQFVVPKHHWQAAHSTGDWSLVGCTVSPGFRFDGFNLAPEDFDIPIQ